MKKKKVFITGVAGFLGSHLAKYLVAKGNKVSGCDNLLGGYLDNVPPEVEFYQYDCKYLNSMKKITKNIDVIYHCAAAPHEGLSVFSPHLITQNVFQITATMLSAAASNKVKRFVFCSSMARYGTNKIPFTENMEPHPQDPYGISKYASELLVKNICETQNMEYAIAVPHNIIGPGQKYDDPYRNVVSIFINRMLQGKQPIIYGNGNQKRTFTYVGEVIESLAKLGFDKKVNKEIVNVGQDDEFITINKLAEIIARQLNFKLSPIYVPSRPQEVKYATCSAAKAKKLLGYVPSHKLEEGISEMIKHIQQKGTKPFRYHLDLEIINEKTPKTWTKKMI